ncbi:MAG: hypothetical protein MRJ92_09035 [Nitrospira sp.]|nr:hypothetical protein [Nitrospira sp.]
MVEFEDPTIQRLRQQIATANGFHLTAAEFGALRSVPTAAIPVRHGAEALTHPAPPMGVSLQPPHIRNAAS